MKRRQFPFRTLAIFLVVSLLFAGVPQAAATEDNADTEDGAESTEPSGGHADGTTAGDDNSTSSNDTAEPATDETGNTTESNTSEPPPSDSNGNGTVEPAPGSGDTNETALHETDAANETSDSNSTAFQPSPDDQTSASQSLITYCDIWDLVFTVLQDSPDCPEDVDLPCGEDVQECIDGIGVDPCGDGSTDCLTGEVEQLVAFILGLIPDNPCDTAGEACDCVNDPDGCVPDPCELQPAGDGCDCVNDPDGCVPDPCEGQELGECLGIEDPCEGQDEDPLECLGILIPCSEGEVGAEPICVDPNGFDPCGDGTTDCLDPCQGDPNPCELDPCGDGTTDCIDPCQDDPNPCGSGPECQITDHAPGSPGAVPTDGSAEWAVGLIYTNNCVTLATPLALFHADSGYVQRPFTVGDDSDPQCQQNSGLDWSAVVRITVTIQDPSYVGTLGTIASSYLIVDVPNNMAVFMKSATGESQSLCEGSMAVQKGAAKAEGYVWAETQLKGIHPATGGVRYLQSASGGWLAEAGGDGFAEFSWQTNFSDVLGAEIGSSWSFHAELVGSSCVPSAGCVSSVIAGDGRSLEVV